MKESEIVKNIIYRVIKEYITNSKIWHIDEIISLIIATTLPYNKNIEFENDGTFLSKVGSIRALQETIEKFYTQKKECKKKAQTLTFESLTVYLDETFTKKLSFSTKESFVKQLHFIASIEEDGYISVKYSKEACEKVLEIYAHLSDLKATYGENTYATEAQDNIAPQKNKENVSDSHTSNTQIPKSGISTAAEKPANETETRIKKKILDLYNNLVYVRGGESVVEKFEYIWEWKISEKEYKDFSEILLNEDCKKHISKLIFNNKYILFIVVAYIAERFKREWNANNREENALIQLGLGANNIVSKIAKKFFANSPERIFKHENTRGTTEWLESLRMEGGLPIKRIISQNTNLSEFAEKLWHDPGSAIEYLKSRIVNQTLKYSYNQKLSVYKFVNTLKDCIDNLSNVFHEDDLNSELIVELSRILQEGRKKARDSKKFGLKYNIWKFFQEFVVYRNIVLKTSGKYDEPNELISIERIRDEWEIAPTYVFKLEIGSKKYLFTQWKYESKDYYRSTTGLTEFPLPSIKSPNYHFTDECIYYIPIDENGEEGEKICIYKFKKEDFYLKFSSDNKMNWCSGSRMEHSAILLTKKCEIKGHFNEIIELGDNFIWIEDFDHITINGKEIYADKFTVLPFPTVYHKITKQPFIRNIEYRNGRDIDNVFILDTTKIKGENFFRQDCETNNTVFSPNSKIEYKLPQNKQYIEFDSKNPPQGYTRLRIDGISFSAYLLPPTLSIKRSIHETYGEIIIYGCNYCVEESWVEVGKNTVVDKYDENNQNKEVIKLLLNKNEEEWLDLEIVRPLKRKDIIFGDRILSADEIIPQKFASKYKKRIFNEDGIQHIESCSTTMQYTDKIEKYFDQFYYIIKTEDNLKFIHIKIENNKLQETPLCIKDKIMVGSNNSVYKCIKEISPNDTGIIIQSLEQNSTELIYYEPILIGNNINEEIRQVPVLDRIRTTMRHGLYFDVLFDKEEINPQFFINYSQDCKREETDIDWHILWEIATYFNIDWLLFCRKEWRNVAKNKDVENRNLIKELFKRSPQASKLKHFIDNYWELKAYIGNKPILGNRSFLGKLLCSKELEEKKWPDNIEKIEEEATDLSSK